MPRKDSDKLHSAELENSRLKSELEKYREAQDSIEICDLIVGYIKKSEREDCFYKQQMDENVYTRSSASQNGCVCTVS